jgi:rhamnulose-1-phosphate aldolase
MKEIDLNRNLKGIMCATQEVAKWLWEKGWAEKNAGNISINITSIMPARPVPLKAKDQRKLTGRFPKLAHQILLVSATGSRMRDLARDLASGLGIIRIAARGDTYQVVWSGRDPQLFAPTSELPSHLMIHEFFLDQRKGNRVILHTHPDELVALTHLPVGQNARSLNRLLRAMHPEIEFFIPRGVGLVPFLKPGSPALGQATVRALRRHDIVLWKKHGCLATGSDIVDVFDLVDVLNKSANIFFMRGRAIHNKKNL